MEPSSRSGVHIRPFSGFLPHPSGGRRYHLCGDNPFCLPDRRFTTAIFVSQYIQFEPAAAVPVLLRLTFGLPQHTFYLHSRLTQPPETFHYTHLRWDPTGPSSSDEILLPKNTVVPSISRLYSRCLQNDFFPRLIYLLMVAFCLLR